MKRIVIILMAIFFALGFAGVSFSMTEEERISQYGVGKVRVQIIYLDGEPLAFAPVDINRSGQADITTESGRFQFLATWNHYDIYVQEIVFSIELHDRSLDYWVILALPFVQNKDLEPSPPDDIIVIPGRGGCFIGSLF